MEYPLQPWSLKVYINLYTLVRLHKKSTNTYRYGTIEPTLQKNSFTGLNITVQAYMFVQYRYSIIAVWLDGVLKIDVSYNLRVFLWICLHGPGWTAQSVGLASLRWLTGPARLRHEAEVVSLSSVYIWHKRF